MASDRDGSSGPCHVGSTVPRVSEEVEDCPIVPDVKLTEATDSCNVRTNPANAAVVSPRTRLTGADRCIRDVENAYPSEAVVPKSPGEKRRPTSNVDDSAFGPRHGLNQPEGQGRFILMPTQLAFRFSPVD